ncbi:MAG: HDIG domain-containing protein [Candidatus Kaelpia aquatica]|nr:HDIG domain-containing protein [Candidatus Kaelpia aquatica]
MKVRERKKILRLRKRKGTRDSLNLKFFVRPLIILSTAFLITVIYHLGGEVSQLNLREGDIALRNVFAPFSFNYSVGIDKNKTEAAKERARLNLGEAYSLDEGVSLVVLDKIKKIFDYTPSVFIEGENLYLPEELIPLMPQGLDFKDLRALKEYNLDLVLKDISEQLEEFYKNSYIISDSDFSRFILSEAKHLYVKSGSDYAQLPRDSLQIVTLSKARDILSSEFNRVFKFKNKELVIGLIFWNLEPNIVFSEEETEVFRKRAEKSVEDVYIRKYIKKNESILSKGRHINKEDLIKLREISSKSEDKKFPVALGVFIFSLLFLSLITISYKYFNPKFYQNVSQLILVSLVILITVAISKGVVLSPLPSYIIPVAMGPMLIAVLVSFPVAVKVSIFVAIISGIIIGDNIVPAVCFLIGSLAGTMAMKDIRNRHQLLKAGIVVSGAQFVALFGLGLAFGMDNNILLREGLMAVSSGILAAFFTLGLLPILEHIFKIITNISLLEYSDLNHPLLKELLVKSPGTYHHALVVSSFAEQAAESVGANPLLARVGSYFHDIGKLEKPEYFSENVSLEKKDKSKHEKLSPSMSSLIIINHVKKGIELAQSYKLPPAIVDFIEQHHGTSLVYYFYHKALEGKSPQDIKEEQFRYPGPKPQTKEVAIVSLADTAEAATRSLQDPTSARIKGLVKEVINNKFIMGELDECELSFKDLHKIEDVFTRLSVSVHHGRIEYPNGKKEL